jgi:NAD(P)-dependent dehydrogenase (short-subunit alcohol dehydrogenase family)
MRKTMPLEFAEKTALITGGGTRIGRASAMALAAEGCVVTIAGRTRSTLEQTVADIEADGGVARFVECDVADEASVQAAVAVAIGDAGRLDFAVNSAGISGGDNLKPTADYATDFFDDIIAVDLRGTFLSMKYELRQMKAQGFGSVVNIGSSRKPCGSGRFCRLRGGEAWTDRTHEGRCARLYAADGIRINATAAGLVETPMIATGRSPEVMAARIAAHPIGRIAQASEIADAVIWLLSNKSSFVTGMTLPVDGGYTAR